MIPFTGIAREIVPLDSDWLFFRGDSAGAEQAVVDDQLWTTIQIPHDWSIEGPFSESAGTQSDGAFLPSGVAWYRKHFTLPPNAAGRRVFVEFDGVMANSEVWINGVSLGKRPNGYVSFRYELTPHIKRAGSCDNVLAIRCDTSAQPASRWYTGTGIYRHARLILVNPVHFDAWGNWFRSEIDLKTATPIARVTLRSAFLNQGTQAHSVRLRIQILGTPIGVETECRPVAPGGSSSITAAMEIPNPRLWDTDHPDRYSLQVDLMEGPVVVDSEVIQVGLRDARFEAATGFWLNGRNMKIKGVCLHHDGGAFGAAVPLSIWEQRLTELRKLGVNAIRTAHNPVDPEFLGLCDRLGLLVLSEYFDTWLESKKPGDYARYFGEWAQIDARDCIRRDRNHPCIIAYSVGNEIHDTTRPESAKRSLAALLELYHREDPTRPVTQALFRPNRSGDYTNGLADMLDVVGQNYRERELIEAWRQKPSRKILGTETKHDRMQWLTLRDTPSFAGQFLWTGVDYLGEARHWPQIATDFGLLDRTGYRKPRALERASWWSDAPVLGVFRRVAPRVESPIDPGYESMQLARRQFLQQQKGPDLFPDWSPEDRASHTETLEVYSNCESVELFLNGRSLGIQKLSADASPRIWTVAFAPGCLRAEGRQGGSVVASLDLLTAGKAARLALNSNGRAISHNWDSVACIEAQILDAQETLVPRAGNPITFSVEGPGEIVAIDNADNSSHESFRGSSRQAYLGRCVVYLRASAPSGMIRLKASSPGLADASFSISVHP